MHQGRRCPWCRCPSEGGAACAVPPRGRKRPARAASAVHTAGAAAPLLAAMGNSQ